MNFRNKSIIFIGAVIILAFGAVAYLIGDKMTITARKMSVDLALSKAQNSFLIVKRELDESILRTKMLAESIEETIDMNTKESALINNALITKLKLRNEINAVWYIPIDSLNRRNDGIDSSFYQSDLNLIHNQLAIQFLQSKIENISVPYQGSDDRLISSILVAVERSNRIIGVLGADLDLYRFQQHFYDNEDLGRAYVSIISEQGFCISHPEESFIGKSIDHLNDADGIREVLASGKKMHNEVHSQFLQVPVIRVYQPVTIGETNTNWLITVSVPLFNVKETVQATRNSTILIGLVLALLLMVFLYFSQRRWLYESTKRRRAERRHMNEVSKLSSIMESTDQIMIFSVGRDYQYTSFNSVHKEEVLKSENELIKEGKNILDAYYGDFRIKMKKYLDRALGGEHFLVEYQRHGIDYQQIFNAISDSEGRVVGVASFKLDISETLQLRKKAQEEEEEKVKAQLKNIKNQINPHFLFNSLNSLYALVDGEPKLARKFIVSLSKVYRYLLDSNNSNLIQLKQEMDFIKQYVFLQRIRFGENLILEYDIPEEAMQYKLPSVSIQSLVENAIKHNVITSDKPLTIRIKITDDNCVLVENPYQPRTDLNHSPGTGLKNLDALYTFLGDRKPYYGIEQNHFIAKLPLF
ncbi:histidine kinase [Marinifilum fragile]|uniref:histidine kinase n=1 Tax=Marinifilum fragile TaxID=570161 RepID=UPI0006CF3C2E|nr:histidine kinase [Marinifilum fragile]